MLNVLVGLQIFIAIALILIILLQNGKGADIGSAFGGGGNNALLGPTDSANILTKLTWVLVFLFFVNTVAISVYQKYSFESEIEVFLEESEEIQSISSEIENLPDWLWSAEVVELVDTLPWGGSGLMPVEVQILSSVPILDLISPKFYTPAT